MALNMGNQQNVQKYLFYAWKAAKNTEYVIKNVRKLCWKSPA